jgi:predicted metal-dependent phosphoesterase TrpH/anti-sigma regulatory factor (Ser/Thr protein kinase)
MVPSAIVKEAKRRGLDVIGVCDHNSAENVAAVVRAGEREALPVIAGMEITSREEVHVLGFFGDEGQLMRVQDLVYEKLAGKNDPEVFGPQVVVDEFDNVLGSADQLLIGATSLSLEETVDAIHDSGGLAIAAHIERERFGLIGQLGFMPEGLPLDAVEVSPRSTSSGWNDLPVVSFSDAHLLNDIGKSSTCFLAEEGAFDEIAKALKNEEGRLSLHVLDIVQNSIAASAKRIEILVAEDTERDILSIEISDDGNGMDAEALERARDPFYTTKTTRRVGLGVPLLAQAARECDGKFQITSEPGSGTTIKASFRRSHPDRNQIRTQDRRFGLPV